MGSTLPVVPSLPEPNQPAPVPPPNPYLNVPWWLYFVPFVPWNSYSNYSTPITSPTMPSTPGSGGSPGSGAQPGQGQQPGTGTQPAPQPGSGRPRSMYEDRFYGGRPGPAGLTVVELPGGGKHYYYGDTLVATEDAEGRFWTGPGTYLSPEVLKGLELLGHDASGVLSGVPEVDYYRGALAEVVGTLGKSWDQMTDQEKNMAIRHALNTQSMLLYGHGNAGILMGDKFVRIGRSDPFRDYLIEQWKQKSTTSQSLPPVQTNIPASVTNAPPAPPPVPNPVVYWDYLPRGEGRD